jgi:hypothetical protein
MYVEQRGSFCDKFVSVDDQLRVICVQLAGSVVSECLALAGRRFFLFRGFEHRMGYGASGTVGVGAAAIGGNTHLVSPLF